MPSAARKPAKKHKMTEALIIDINKDETLTEDVPDDLLQTVASFARRAWAQGGGDGAAAEISLLLTGDEHMRELNRTYRDKDRPTNVLSFAAADGDAPRPAGAPILLGDIVLSCGIISEEAQRHGKSFADHICHLAVHGVLHLAGYDHETGPEAEEMRALETEILAAGGIGDPYRNWIDGAA